MAGEIKGLAEEEWFSDGCEEQLWVEGTVERSLAERRAAQRNPATVRIRLSPDGKGATSGDISLGGMLVTTNFHLEKGREVGMLIDSPYGPLLSRGLVRWTTVGKGSGHCSDCISVGIQFTWMSLAMGRLMRSGIAD